MESLSDFRQQYPMYNDMPDYDLAKNIHKQFYSDMPEEEVFKRLKLNGFDSQNKEPSFQFTPNDYQSPGGAALEGTSRIPRNVGSLAQAMWGALSDVPEKGGYADTGKAALQGLIGGAREGLNIPHNITEYAREFSKRNLPEQLHVPDWIQAWKPSEESVNTLNRAEEYWGPENTNRFTDFVKGAARQIPTAIATGNPFAGLFANAIGENRNVFEDIFTAKTLQHSPKAVNPIVKPIAKGTGKIASKVKEGVTSIGKGRYSQAKTVERGNKIVSDLEHYYNKGYNTITNDPRLPSIEWNIPDDIFHEFNKANPKTSGIIDKALISKNPTDVHHAASKVGNYIYKQEGSVAPNHTGLSSAYKLKEALEMGLDNSLNAVPELHASYRNLDKQFANDLGRVGHKVRSKLKKYRKNELGIQDVMRAFKLPESSAEFRHKFGSELPGIKNAKNPETWKNLPITNEGVNLLRKYFGGK